MSRISASSTLQVLLASLKDQIRHNWLVVLRAAGAALMIVLGAFAFGQAVNVPLDVLTRDPAAISYTPFYYGLFTFLNIALWTTALISSLFGLYLLAGSPQRRVQRRFLLASVIVNGLLLADDAFMLHEEVVPRYLGIPEPLVYTLYGLVLLGYAALFYRQIFSSGYILLVCAGVFFALSISVDLSIPINWEGLIAQHRLAEHQVIFIEDSLKFVGIVMWAVFFARYLLRFIPSLYKPVSQSLELP